MALSPGTRFGLYEVTAVIGAGGMGEVYRARDSKLKRDVALKVLPTEVAGDDERLARFEREAEMLAALNHPHIAQIYGFEQAGGLAALIMELVDGEDLSQRLARGPVPLDEALPIARQIADALDAAHQAGIMHRDLKPANVRVRVDGTVKVLDFGLAKPGASGATGADRVSSPTITTPAMTMQGMILGTAAYMAPEQAKGKAVDKRADIWAFGCVLYEMLAGRRAFEGEDVTDTLTAVLRDTPDWSALPADTPAGVRRLLVRCLERDPRRRLRDLGDAVADLEDTGPLNPAEPAAVSRTPRLLIAGLALATAAAAALAIPAVSHWREPAPAAPRPIRLVVDAPPNTSRLLSPIVAPDGRTIAFAALPAGRNSPEVWIRSLEATEAEVAPGLNASGGAAWAPDSSALIFPSGNSLRHFDLASKALRTVTTLPNMNLASLSQFFATWNAEGVILFGLGGAIYRVSTGGGEAAAVTIEGLPDGTEPRFPSFLPDGRRFLLLVAGYRGDAQTYVASLDGGPARPLFPAESQAEYTEPSPGQGRVLFVRDGNLLAQPFDATSAMSTGDAFVVARQVASYTAEFIGAGRFHFSVSRDGVLSYISQPQPAPQSLTWYDRAGNVLGTIGEPDYYFSPRLSPDGNRVAVARRDARTMNGDIYVFDLVNGGNLRLTFDPADDNSPIWTLDGEHVIWAARRNGRYQILRKRADGAGQEQLVRESTRSMSPDDLTSDGRSVVYRETDPVTNNDLWLLPLDGGEPSALVRTAADEPRARFSPDGAFIGYISNESGRFESYLQPFPSLEGKWQVSPDGGGMTPLWRADRSEVFFPSGGFMAARRILSTNPLRMGDVQRLFPLPLVPRGSFFNVSPDGQRFLFTVDPVQPAEALKYHVALHWDARP